MLIAVRISAPDRPGTLAAVTACLAASAVDIVTIDVVDRSHGVVVDDLCLDVGGIDPLHVGRLLVEVPGLVVESVREVTEPPSITAALELAATLSVHREEAIERLVSGLPKALRGSWCIALSCATGRLSVLEASPGAPRLTATRLPWLPLDAPRRLAPAGWMPTSWRMRAALGGLELAAAPLSGPEDAVLVARHSGLRFRAPELRQLDILARMAGPVPAWRRAGSLGAALS